MTTYNCLQCGKTIPPEAPYLPDPVYIRQTVGRAGPFCNGECAKTWSSRPYAEQLQTIWPSFQAVEDLFYGLESGRYVRDEPGDKAWKVGPLSFIEHVPVHRCPQLGSADYSIVNSVKRCPGCPRFELKPWHLLEIPIAAYGTEVVR